MPVVYENDFEVFIHDLASPVTSIDLNLHLLRNQITSREEPVVRAITRAVNSLNQLNYIIDNKRGNLSIQKPKESINLYQEILDVKTAHDFLLEAESVKFEIDCPQDLTLFANKYRFRQVIDNLVRNAIDALTASDNKAKLLRLSVCIEKQNTVITILDDGCGMDPQVISKVFDLNYSTKPGHSGIGLWLIQQIVIREFGGHVEIDSEVNKYTQVKLTLPKSRGRDTVRLKDKEK